MSRIDLSRSLAAFESSPDLFRILHSLPAHATQVPPRNRTFNSTHTRLIVLDSSFNPPTRAHASMVRSALDSHPDSRVLLLLAVRNADKPVGPATFPQRLAMMRLLADDVSTGGAAVDVGVTKEAYFHGKAGAILASAAYTISTSTSASTSASTSSPASANAQPQSQPLLFLVGFDTLVRIFDPRYYPNGMAHALQPLFDHAALRVTARPDDGWGSAGEQRERLRQWAHGGLDSVGGDVAWLDSVELVDAGEGDDGAESGVSSSAAREAVRRGDGDALTRLVSEGVQAFIRSEGLYRHQA